MEWIKEWIRALADTVVQGNTYRVMKDWISWLLIYISDFHDRVWAYNRGLPASFTDKELHFIFVGLFGLGLLLAVWLLFKLLARLGLTGTMAWLFTFVTVVAVAFAIELGQAMTGRGNVEAGDIAYGILGFLAVSAAVAALYWVIRFIVWLFRVLFKKEEEE